MEEVKLPPVPGPTPEPTPQPAARQTGVPAEVPAATLAPVADSSVSSSVPPVDVPSAPVPPSLVPPSPVPPSLQHADRTTGLVVFGVFQIIVGLLTALLIPLVALGAFVSRLGPGGSMRPAQLLSAISTYAFAAAVLITLGIGSIQYRRWARALTVVISWYWLIMGALITVLLTAVMPVMMRTAMQAQRSAAGAPTPSLSTGVMAVVITLIIVFMAFFLIVVPIAFLVFYSREDVAATCREHDPVERWTDRTPLPVLGASVVFFVGAIYLASVGLTTPIFPFFGRYLTGVVGGACFLILAAIEGYLAVGSYRLKPIAWWIAIIALPIRLLSMVLTYLKADLMQAYSKIGMSDRQLNALNANPMLRGHVILWWSLISLCLFFGYLLWIKRYFKTPQTQQLGALPAEAI